MFRLRIFEQLIILFFIAVLLPLCIAAVIVINVNQHAVRAQLKYSTSISVDNIHQKITDKINDKKKTISYLSQSIKYLDSNQKVLNFLSDIKSSSSDIKEIYLLNDKGLTHSSINYYSPFRFEIIEKIDKNKYIKEVIDLKTLETELFNNKIGSKRDIFIIDSNNNLILSNNNNLEYFNKIIKELPGNLNKEQIVFFGKQKNLPKAALRLKSPDWTIIVATPKQLISYGIIKARFKIILTLIIAAVISIISGVWYSLSLRTSIKQLFKAILAIGKGNYKRRIRLIRNVFTPYEVIFLSKEFNNMVKKINKSYKNLQSANEQLSKLDQMKSNLIDTVSHEFRTPLTCIKGYTSRLLRNDIKVDENTKIKSLKVIKQQTERLSRMVEDLLVIPDIESKVLRICPDQVNLKESIENCTMSFNQKQINLQIPDNLPNVWVDPDRLEQIIMNLIDNANKYSNEDSEINLKVSQDKNFAVIKIQNECNHIPDDKLKTLLDKFTRIEDNLTRTTRGTGLGLFITKGLIENMGGKVKLSNKKGFKISFTLPLYIDQTSELAELLN